MLYGLVQSREPETHAWEPLGLGCVLMSLLLLPISLPHETSLSSFGEEPAFPQYLLPHNLTHHKYMNK